MSERTIRIVAFLKRDICTFIPGHAMRKAYKERLSLATLPDTDNDIHCEGAVFGELLSPAAAQKGNFLPLMLDAREINRKEIRRQFLDWRDDSVVQLQKCGLHALGEFSIELSDSLAELGLVREVFASVASEVVIDRFDASVRNTILLQSKLVEDNLNALIARINGHGNSTVTLVDERPDAQLSKLSRVKFKSSNKDEIIRVLQELVLGKHGIVDRLNVQITELCREQLESIRRADKNSI